MRTMINILPASYRHQQMVRNRAVQWTSIIGAVLIGGWVWHWLEMREHIHLTQRLDVLSREHAPTQTMLKQIVDMRQQLKELQQQEVVAKELETQRNALALLGVISNAAQQAKGPLRITKLDLSDFQGVTSNPSAAQGAVPSGLILAGTSLSNGPVYELINALKRAGIFHSVELENVKQRGGNGTPLWDYEVRCQF